MRRAISFASSNRRRNEATLLITANTREEPSAATGCTRSLVFDVFNGASVPIDKLYEQYRNEWLTAGVSEVSRQVQNWEGESVTKERLQHILDEEATVKNFAGFLQVFGIIIALAKDLVFPRA